MDELSVFVTKSLESKDRIPKQIYAGLHMIRQNPIRGTNPIFKILKGISFP